MLLTMHNSGYIFRDQRCFLLPRKIFQFICLFVLNIEKENPDLPINHISSKELSTRTWMII